MLDLTLAVAHHLLIFGLFGVLFSEIVAVQPRMSSATVTRIASIDLWYGLLAGLILIVGFSRAVFAAKGWGYYSHNVFFWAKIAVFAAIGLLSLPPTLVFIRWRRAGITPSDSEVARVRRYLTAELALFALMPAFAAAMARGYGSVT
jgi:putative membrane protein